MVHQASTLDAVWACSKSHIRTNINFENQIKELN